MISGVTLFSAAAWCSNRREHWWKISSGQRQSATVRHALTNTVPSCKRVPRAKEAISIHAPYIAPRGREQHEFAWCVEGGGSRWPVERKPASESHF